MDIHQQVAQTYSQALFELLNERKLTKEELANIHKQLQLISELFLQHSEIKRFFENQFLENSKREEVLRAVFKAYGDFDPLLCNFIFLIASKGRISLLKDIANSFQALLDRQSNVVRGKIFTATPLQEKDLQQAEELFTKKTNKKVFLENVQRPDIIGGFLVEINGMTYDASLASAVRRLKRNLVRQSI